MSNNRNKKRNGLAAMDVSADQTITYAQAMDTSESVAPAMVMGGGGRQGSLQISTSFMAETGEGENICDFAGKNGDAAGDGFLLVVK
ncbi:hypothetical protein H5410_009164 [Solanum commersonii]|uniref:Uncharacterized protein n=1 Tax=Solanum commersonii TaxID=4109 RepID=A0A9J6AIQ7_SOLCO|nr:hypothetical protein H5410_009164 [Solanum commersonii]